MLFKQNKSKVTQATKSILFGGIVALLGSCSNSAALESFVSADPELTKDKAESAQTKRPDSPRVSSNSDLSNSPEDILISENAQSEKQQETTNNKPQSSNPQREKAFTEQELANSKLRNRQAGLPESFPPSLPIYPRAQLKKSKLVEDKSSGTLTWQTTDNSKAVADYYQAELISNGWKIIKPFTPSSKQNIARAIAIKNDVRVDLTLLRASDQDKANNSGNPGTKFTVIYQPLEQDIAQSGISQAADSEQETDKTQSSLESLGSKPESAPTNPGLIEDNNNETSRSKPPTSAPVQPKKSKASTKQAVNLSGIDFNDADQAPEQLRQPLESVAALDILTPYTGDGNIELSKFAPNQIITRGEYARWLIAANNRYFADTSGKKIYLATKTNEPAFQDVKPNSPDFEAIQSLAEAGLLPSRLTEDSTSLLFKPDAPLKREDLLSWKVPLDMRQALPKASIEAIQESWGFQDAADIESNGIRALYADFQNGDRSNVRRIFGYTTLFQPKKPVTRAEAAASLWYFGFQGDGVTAREILEVETESNN